MDAAALRQALAGFMGADRFRKFVQQFGQAGRLRFWQEEVWGRFVAAHPELAVSVDELRVALRVCELHGCELLSDRVEVSRGCIDYAKRYIHARNRLFPRAALG